MLPTPTTRRSFLAATALAGASLPLAGRARAETAPASAAGGDFRYEVQRTEAEWRAMLTEEEYRILREGGTEPPTSHPLWDDYSEGEFHCRGCELPLYSSDWRANIMLGYVFFFHSHPNAVLTSIDGNPYPGGEPDDSLVEVHCRRCGSHLGHIISLDDRITHCINGTCLERRAPEA